MTNEYENTLRTIISLVIGDNDTTNFGISSDRIKQWEEKREIEKKKNNGILIESRLIYFSDFYDLKPIVHKNWNVFKEILLNKKIFEANFDQIESLRNTVSHGRNIWSFQNQLIAGITGELKSTLVKYHNKNMDADDYFIRILKLSDSLGNQWGIENLDNTLLIAKGILRVNDQIEIFIEAYDPKNRVITFEFGSGQSCKSQDNGKFELIVTKQMIGRPSYFWVKVHTKDSDYENILRKDLLYTVLP
jgi:hypothetical protein